MRQRGMFDRLLGIVVTIWEFEAGTVLEVQFA